MKLIYNGHFRHGGIPKKFWWAATDLGYWFAYQDGRAYKRIENLHRTLGDITSMTWLIVGDVVRIQPNHISFGSLEAVEAIHGIRTASRKGDIYTYVMRHKADIPYTLFSEMYFVSKRSKLQRQKATWIS